jgi:hypothetical protein
MKVSQAILMARAEIRYFCSFDLDVPAAQFFRFLAQSM